VQITPLFEGLLEQVIRQEPLCSERAPTYRRIIERRIRTGLFFYVDPIPAFTTPPTPGSSVGGVPLPPS